MTSQFHHITTTQLRHNKHDAGDYNLSNRIFTKQSMFIAPFKTLVSSLDDTGRYILRQHPSGHSQLALNTIPTDSN